MTDWRELLMLRLLRALTALRITKPLRTRGTIHPFTEYFKGFEKVKAIREIFGEKTRAHDQVAGFQAYSSKDGHSLRADSVFASSQVIPV